MQRVDDCGGEHDAYLVRVRARAKAVGLGLGLVRVGTLKFKKLALQRG